MQLVLRVVVSSSTPWTRSTSIVIVSVSFELPDSTVMSFVYSMGSMSCGGVMKIAMLLISPGFSVTFCGAVIIQLFCGDMVYVSVCSPVFSTVALIIVAAVGPSLM